MLKALFNRLNNSPRWVTSLELVSAPGKTIKLEDFATHTGQFTLLFNLGRLTAADELRLTVELFPTPGGAPVRYFDDVLPANPQMPLFDFPFPPAAGFVLTLTQTAGRNCPLTIAVWQV